MGLHGQGLLLALVGIFQLGVRNVQPTIKMGGLAKQEVGAVVLHLFVHGFDSTKPNEFYIARTIGKEGYETFATSASFDVFHHDLSPQLNIRHSFHKVGYPVDNTTVNILIGKVVEQIAQGGNAKVITQKLWLARDLRP